MKIASLKFSEEEPSFHDIGIDDEGNVRYYNEKGQLHRLDGPAIEYANGDKEWYQNNRRHREDGPAYERADGSKFWYMNGERHRLNGPAEILPRGNKFWYVNDKLHRLDGPAIEYFNGIKGWWVNGKFIGSSREGFTQEDFERWKKEHGYESN